MLMYEFGTCFKRTPFATIFAKRLLMNLAFSKSNKPFNRKLLNIRSINRHFFEQ